MEELRRREAIAARGLEFAILTASRTGEVIGARWPEIKQQAARHLPLPQTRNAVPLPPISELVKMPGDQIVYSLSLSADGTATLTDGKGKELAVQKSTLRPSASPSLHEGK